MDLSCVEASTTPHRTVQYRPHNHAPWPWDPILALCGPFPHAHGPPLSHLAWPHSYTPSDPTHCVLQASTNSGWRSEPSCFRMRCLNTTTLEVCRHPYPHPSHALRLPPYPTSHVSHLTPHIAIWMLPFPIPCCLCSHVHPTRTRGRCTSATSGIVVTLRAAR